MEQQLSVLLSLGFLDFVVLVRYYLLDCVFPLAELLAIDVSAFKIRDSFFLVTCICLGDDRREHIRALGDKLWLLGNKVVDVAYVNLLHESLHHLGASVCLAIVQASWLDPAV